MGNWNRHFVRVGADGNMGVYDQNGNRFIRENIGTDGLPAKIVIIPSSTDNNDTDTPQEVNAIGFMSDSGSNPRINPYSAVVLNLVSKNTGFLQNDFNMPIKYMNAGSISGFRNINTSLNAFSTMAGTPDLRTGVTAADASAITIYSSTAAGVRYKIDARIMSTVGTSATYTLTWTEGGAARTVALAVTAVGAPVSDNFVIQPDSATDITAQITALTSSTVNVAAIVSVLG